MPNTILKRWNGTSFEELYPKTTVTQISASGTPSSSTFLRGDGQWSTVPSGTGTVTSVGITAGTGITVSGSPITTSGSMTVTNSSPNATHTGDVTGATALTIANDAVTNGKLANMAVNTIKGRITTGTGDPEDLTATQVRTILNVANGATANTGTVTSVGLSLPSIFSVSGSPVTTSGTLTGALANQNANIVLAGPGSGSAATPTFRSLVAADIPNLDAAKITSGTVATARLGSGTASSTTFLRGDNTWATAGGGAPTETYTTLVDASFTFSSNVSITNYTTYDMLEVVIINTADDKRSYFRFTKQQIQKSFAEFSNFQHLFSYFNETDLISGYLEFVMSSATNFRVNFGNHLNGAGDAWTNGVDAPIYADIAWTLYGITLS
jgi:hypothetical protein